MAAARTACCAAIIATNLGMGLITPPTAPILYLGALVGKTPLSGMRKPTMVFLLLAHLPVVLLTTFYPGAVADPAETAAGPLSGLARRRHPSPGAR